MGQYLRKGDSDKVMANMSSKVVSFGEIEWFDRNPPSRNKAIYLYARSWFWKNIGRYTSTWPYVSGDSFVKLADYSISTEKDLQGCDPKLLAQSRKIFVKSELFGQFVSEYAHHLNTGHVLITGNGDTDFEKIPESLIDIDFRWFAQNSFITNDSRVTSIPIGIENISLGSHGRLGHLHISRDFNQNRILFGPMGDTHPSRRSLLTSALELQNVFYLPTKRLPPRQYVKLSGNFKYVFCPRGNGVDTHRFWESLYRGQTPVILESDWSKSLEGLGLPFVCIPTLESVTAIVPELDFGKPDFNPNDLEALWMPFWGARINQIKQAK
jgi:hypothetical protein